MHNDGRGHGPPQASEQQRAEGAGASKLPVVQAALTKREKEGGDWLEETGSEEALV